MTATTKPTAAWPFQLDTCEQWAYWEGLFTKEECEHIISLGKASALTAAKVGNDGVSDLSIRDSKIAWLFPNEDTGWVFDRVAAVVNRLNNDYFKFDLFGMVEGLQFTEYKAPTGAYHAHVDSMKGITTRKLSVSIQLSADEDYEGGALVLHLSQAPFKTPTQQGKAIVFPSYTLHGVEPVTKGTRYSLVCWVTGAPFR